MATCLMPNCNLIRVCEESKLCQKHHNQRALLPGAIRLQGGTTTTHLLALDRNSTEFRTVEQKFLTDWVKPNAEGVRVEEVFHIVLPDIIVNAYKNYRTTVDARIRQTNPGLLAGNERMLWHGTDHYCSIFYGPRNVKDLCLKADCAGCGILLNSFLMAKVGINQQGRTFQRLGRGLYFTPYTSKAHFYGHGGARAHPNDSKRTCRIMFLSKVVLGNPWMPDRVSQSQSGPQRGFDSTWGRVGHCPHGGAVLRYEEYAVYRHDACIPLNYIVYSYTSSSE